MDPVASATGYHLSAAVASNRSPCSPRLSQLRLDAEVETPDLRAYVNDANGRRRKPRFDRGIAHPKSTLSAHAGGLRAVVGEGAVELLSASPEWTLLPVIVFAFGRWRDPRCASRAARHPPSVTAIFQAVPTMPQCFRCGRER